MSRGVPVALASILIASAMPGGAVAQPAEAVVSILSSSDGAKGGIGSGFFISADGQIVTAYHVVTGARILQIFDGRNWHNDVIVAAIAPDRDLALLQVRGLQRRVAFIPLLREIPASFWKSQAEVYGHPAILQTTRARLVARPISDRFAPSGSLRTPDLRPLFARRDVDLIPLDMTIYSGVSGAPLLANGQAVGVISGSINEGGSIAWAIPARYVSSMTSVNKSPSEIGTWPPLTLMAGSWVSLRKHAQLGTGVLLAITHYGEASNDVLSAIEQMTPEMTRLVSDYVALMQSAVDHAIRRRGRNIRVRDDPTVRSAFDTIEDQMDRRVTASFERKLSSGFDQWVKAGENLRRELDQYFLSLPQTGRNEALRMRTISVIVENAEAIASIGKAIERMGDSLEGFTELQTLGEIKDGLPRYAEGAQTALKNLNLRLADIGRHTGAIQDSIERLFDADGSQVK